MAPLHFRYPVNRLVSDSTYPVYARMVSLYDLIVERLAETDAAIR